MKIKPDQWTHHHVHRLFHISLGLCFGFISLVLVGQMAVALFNSKADDSTVTKNISVTASIEGISPGPINAGGAGGGSNPLPTANPTITIEAQPHDKVPLENQYYIFGNEFPAFSGATSVKNGLVFITIHGQTYLNSTVQADDLGHWYWGSPESLPVGTYNVTATVYDSYDLNRSGSAKANFKIILIQNGKPVPIVTNPTFPKGEESQLKFGVFVQVLPEYKVIEPPHKVVVLVKLISNGSSEFEAQDLVYKIISPDGRVILDTKDNISFSKHSEFLKTFYIAPETLPGEYTLMVTSSYKKIISKASATFIIKEPTVPVVGTSGPSNNILSQWPMLIWLLLLLLLLLFIVLTFYGFKQAAKHHKQIHAIA